MLLRWGDCGGLGPGDAASWESGGCTCTVPVHGVLYVQYDVYIIMETYHLGRLVDFTTGDMPSLYRLLVLLKFTMLKMTLCTEGKKQFSSI